MDTQVQNKSIGRLVGPAQAAAESSTREAGLEPWLGGRSWRLMEKLALLKEVVGSHINILPCMWLSTPLPAPLHQTKSFRRRRRVFALSLGLLPAHCQVKLQVAG